MKTARDVRTVEQAAVLLAVAKSEEVMRSGTQHLLSGLRDSNGATAAPRVATAGPRSVSSCAGVVGDLLARYFPENLAWATRIVKRESNCTPGAVNHEGCDTSSRTNSHAYGLFQMCYPLHQSIFAAVGCSDPLDAECGVKAARRLYDGAGAGPWGG